MYHLQPIALIWIYYSCCQIRDGCTSIRPFYIFSECHLCYELVEIFRFLFAEFLTVIINYKHIQKICNWFSAASFWFWLVKGFQNFIDVIQNCDIYLALYTIGQIHAKLFMYFSSAHSHFPWSIFKYILLFISKCVNKFIIYFSVLVADLAVVHM